MTTGKGKRAGWQAMTVKFRKDTHRQLRIIAITRRTTVQDMISEAAEQIVEKAAKAGATR